MTKIWLLKLVWIWINELWLKSVLLFIMSLIIRIMLWWFISWLINVLLDILPSRLNVDLFTLELLTASLPIILGFIMNDIHFHIFDDLSKLIVV